MENNNTEIAQSSSSTIDFTQLESSLEIKEGELRVDSRIICRGLGISNHTDYRNNILVKYETSFEILGVVLKTTTA